MKTIKNIFNEELNISYNLKENNKIKILRIFWTIIYIFKAIKIGIRGIFSEQLGSRVIYEGKILYINNWAASGYPSLSCQKDGIYIKQAERNKIKNIIDIKEIFHRFNFMFNWYAGYWLDIDVSKKIYKK